MCSKDELFICMLHPDVEMTEHLEILAQLKDKLCLYAMTSFIFLNKDAHPLKTPSYYYKALTSLLDHS